MFCPALANSDHTFHDDGPCAGHFEAMPQRPHLRASCFGLSAGDPGANLPVALTISDGIALFNVSNSSAIAYLSFKVKNDDNHLRRYCQGYCAFAYVSECPHDSVSTG